MCRHFPRQHDKRRNYRNSQIRCFQGLERSTGMTEDSLVDPLVTETAHRLLSEICDHESIQAAEARGQAPEIWNAFAETGFPWISIDEDAGGPEGHCSTRLKYCGWLVTTLHLFQPPKLGFSADGCSLTQVRSYPTVLLQSFPMGERM